MGLLKSKMWLVIQLQCIAYDWFVASEGAGSGYSGQVGGGRTAGCIALGNTHAAAWHAHCIDTAESECVATTHACFKL